MQRINLGSAPDQRVSAILDGRRFTFRFRFNAWSGRWHFDMALDDQPILYGRRVVANRNLLPEVVFPGRLFAYVYAGDGSQPGLDDFASGAAALFYVSEDELTAALAA